MLSGQTQKQLELAVANLPTIVESAFSAYEEKNEKFEISLDRAIYKEIYYNLYRVIIARVEEEKPITILPLYGQLALALVRLNFNIPLFIELLVLVKQFLFGIVTEFGGKNSQLEQYFDSYINLIVVALRDEQVFRKGLKSEQLIQLVGEYAPSDVVIRDSFSSKTISNRTLYPLIDKDKYWEAQRENYIRDKKYTTRDLTIYRGKVYSLNQDIANPTTDRFNPDEWSEFRSKFLIRNNLFNNKLKTNAKTYVSSALNSAEDINGVISDSKIKELKSDITYDEEDLKLTFAGEGESIVKNILALKTTLGYFGNSEGSPIGNIDYIASFCEYLYASLYGRQISAGFATLGGIGLLGNFNLLFNYGAKTNRIAGLKFLESFKSLNSFKQNITLPLEVSVVNDPNGITSSATYNPIYAKYFDGVKDRFFSEEINPYSDQTDVDVLLFGIEQLVNLSNRLGDLIEALKSSLGKEGILPGYEGLGPISIQVNELSKVFISSVYLRENYNEGDVLPGFNGLVSNLLRSYKKLSDVLSYPPLTSGALEKITTWGRKIQSSLEKILTNIEEIGYLPGSYIPNISFKFSTLEREKLVDQLRSLNFQESEIDQFLSAKSFEELLLKFAPISDSADQLSFFRAYELSQLIYEFGGESAIDSYIGYLYQQDSNNLINLLSIAIKDKTSGVIYNEYRYGKLVGLLINLTFAINPDQLILFKEYLSGNNLTLFESISFLLRNKEANLVLDRDKIDLLKPLTDSLIYGSSPFGFDSKSINYEVANEQTPIALKQWTELIDKNLGNASTRLIQNIYDKSVGLTPKELITVLNTTQGRNHNDFGQLIDGFEGGRLTQLINYGYLSGLLHKLSYYSNSYQIPNFLVSSEAPVKLNGLVEVVSNLSNLLDLTLTNFTNSIEYDLSQDSVDLYSFDNLITTQNKSPREITKIIKGLVPLNGDINNFGSPVADGNAEIVSSPGIGNSPVPESIPKEGTITPEQANQLSPQIKNNFSFISNSSKKDINAPETINKFISFIEENKLIVGIKSGGGVIERNANVIDKIDLESKSAKSLSQADRTAEVKLPSFYQEATIQDKISLQEEENLINQKLISKFDAVESCKRFGGSNCESRVPSNINTCGKPNNKSIYSQRDDSPTTTAANGSIGIDRPFGSYAELKPDTLFLPYNQNNKPAYFGLFGPNVKISNNGSPIKETIDTTPLVFTKDKGGADEGLYAPYYNSEYGLIEAIKAKWEKDEPFNCSLLEDPYAYMACMNLLKCKRFKKEGGASSLKFCPKTLAGGLFK